MLLASSAYGVVLVVERSQELDYIEDPSWFRANEVTVVVSGIQVVFPNIFDLIGAMEEYHPAVALRWQLGRYDINQLIACASLRTKIEATELETKT